jgi:hypothetical protein
MSKSRDAFEADPILSRKHTADLLRQLRRMTNELRALKQRVADLENYDKAATLARSFLGRRRAS